MARPRKATIEVETTTRILTAAEEAFGQHGFSGARLADIAAAAGIRRSSLLYHFKTKEALYEAVLESAFEEMAKAIAEAIARPGTYLERVEGTTRALIAFEQARPHLGQVIRRALFEAEDRLRAEMTRRLDLVLATTTRFVEQEGSVPAGVPGRAAIATLFLSHLLKTTLGDHGRTLFGEGEATLALARALLDHDAAGGDR